MIEYDDSIFINKEHMKKRFEFNDQPSYVTHIIGETKYKYGQQEQVTVRNHNRSTVLEWSVLKYCGALTGFTGSQPRNFIMCCSRWILHVSLRWPWPVQPKSCYSYIEMSCYLLTFQSVIYNICMTLYHDAYVPDIDKWCYDMTFKLLKTKGDII